MGDGFPFFDILLFAMVAAFLVLRLRSVLGRRTGHERPRRDLLRDQGSADGSSENVVTLPDRDNHPEQPAAAADSPVAAGLTQIKVADRNFDEIAFQAGARTAFEIVVTSFSAGDTDTLRPLTSDEVYANFEAAIRAREDAGHVYDSTLIGIKSTDIIDAQMESGTASLTVKIVSEQINVTREEEGDIVEGSPTVVSEVTDIWTFARVARSSNPNWTLVATGSSN
jgi:predicted lipid-binding transport protein (Tim44 family)